MRKQFNLQTQTNGFPANPTAGKFKHSQTTTAISALILLLLIIGLQLTEVWRNFGLCE